MIKVASVPAQIHGLQEEFHSTLSSLGPDTRRYNSRYEPLAKDMVRAQAASQTWRKEAIKPVLR